VATALVLYAPCALAWMAARAWLQIQGVRQSPQTYASLVLKEVGRFKPFTEWMYTDPLIYSFHAGIPMPCQLAVVSFKRLWCGDMTNARIAAEVRACTPGLILLKNDGRETVIGDLLAAEYRLVYQDGMNRLYAHRSIAKKPKRGI
jgi:hypothetical protein